MFAGNLSLIRDNFDPAAQAYIDAVEAADGQPLEAEVKRAITRFVKGCKADGIWNAIKASCILAGARTLTGALVPLVGTAPTNNNFVSGDYNRKTGLKGATSNKWLESNRANNADPQNSNHNVVYATEAAGEAGAFYLGTDSGAVNGSNGFYRLTGSIYFFNRNLGGSVTSYTVASPTGLIGTSRNSSTSFDIRHTGTTYPITKNSAAPTASLIEVFARTGQSPTTTNDSRLSFYSIGEALDLEKLDNRVTALMNAFDTYIP